MSIDETALAFPDDLCALRNQVKRGYSQDETEPFQSLCRPNQGSFQLKAVGFIVQEVLFNGLITNDKFCLTRMRQLQLSWWRRPLRIR